LRDEFLFELKNGFFANCGRGAAIYPAGNEQRRFIRAFDKVTF